MTDLQLGACVCASFVLIFLALFVWAALRSNRQELTDEQWREWMKQVLDDADKTQP